MFAWKFHDDHNRFVVALCLPHNGLSHSCPLSTHRVASTSSRCRLLTAVALSPCHAALHPVTVSEDPVILTVICHPLTVVLPCCGLRIHSLSSYHPHCHPLTGHPTILTVNHSCHLVNLTGIHSSSNHCVMVILKVCLTVILSLL